MCRPPSHVASKVLRDGAIVDCEPREDHLLDVTYHLDPLLLGEVGLAELDVDPHIRDVDVLGVELAVRDLNTLFGRAGLHV